MEALCHALSSHFFIDDDPIYVYVNAQISSAADARHDLICIKRADENRPMVCESALMRA
jgi:hypothetical protein